MNDRIREIRKERKLNQTEFGKKIGVKQTTVAGYESGVKNPIDAVVKSICREFNINEEWLRHGTGSKYIIQSEQDESDQYVTQLLQDSKTPFSFLIKEIMHTYNELDDKSQEAFNSFLSKLIFNISSSVVDDTPPMSKDDENAFWQDLAAKDKVYWENHNIAAANGNVDEKEFIDLSGVRMALDNDED